MKYIKQILFFILLFNSLVVVPQSSLSKIDSFFIPSESFNSTRFYSALTIGSAAYGVGTYFLYNSWYKNNGVGNFHLFNDWGEWQHMDKVGHVYTAYTQSSIMFESSRWTGLDDQKSLVFGITMGMILQSTIEVLDGYSPKWGFSLSDMAANIIGASVFYAEQKYWGEQKILFKVSSKNTSYSSMSIYSSNSTVTTNLQSRANDLFGSTFFQRYLKDYNAQTYWVSFNIKSLLNLNRFPSWLNIAVGYSGENMFGGFVNEWSDIEGNHFSIPNNMVRYKQFMIAPDIDLSRINVKSHFLKSIFKGFSIFKVPTPALEITNKGGIVLHLIYF